MNAIEKAWHTDFSWSLLLLPLSWLFRLIAATRRLAFQRGWKQSYRSRLPVLVVGNINVGGSGKTPTVIWLCEQLTALGWKPAVVSRGYGGKAAYYPYLVKPDSLASEVGDEPLLIHLRTQCPVVVSPKRAEAVAWLENHTDVDLIITDDGLQHYQLQRDLELVVIDGMRRFGNKKLLPAGPLREPLSRLNSVDYLICNGGTALAGEYQMQLKPSALCNLTTGQTIQPQELMGKKLLAIAGIGHPQRFFDTLNTMAITVSTEQPLADHQPLDKQQLAQWAKEYDAVLMTEKDAVKCTAWAPTNSYYLPVSATLPTQLLKQLDLTLKQIQQESTHGI